MRRMATDVLTICQALARVVVESMGGPSSAGELAQRCWDHMQQLKNRLVPLDCQHSLHSRPSV